MNANDNLLPEVRQRVEALDRETTLEWGGEWVDGTARVREVAGASYNQHTRVRSPYDGYAAFNKYIHYYEHVRRNFTPEHDAAVVLPCGSTKPIGTSAIHQKKLDAIEQAGWDDVDILIMSEPCTIIPHGERLTMAAVNYDFPPEFTEEKGAPRVFEVFVNRLTGFLNEMNYDTVYTYLVERHQNKFDTAMERTASDTEMVRVPGATFNPETGAYSGDMFQSAENIADKLRAIRGETLQSPSAADFYAERPEYSVA